MSNEMKHHQEGASDDLRLPDELAACEAQLASEPLAAPRLSRDEVLYRAGWAARDAELAAVAHMRPVIGYRGRTVAMSSACSAAMAACLAIALTLGLAPRTAGPGQDETGSSRGPQVVDRRQFEAAPPTVTQDAWLAALQSFAAARRFASGEPLATAGDLRFAQWSQAASTAERSAVSEEAPAMTTRALLEEMLPRARSAEVETGGGASGVLNLLRPLAWGGETI